MTQEEKELLMVDLCARLPYGVKIELMPITRGKCTTLTPIILYDYFISDDVNYLPYLRPLSSITEEEKEEIKPLFSKFIGEFGKRVLVVEQNKMALYQDWLNRHHFDYRGLIKKSLAIEAPKDMYKTE